MEVPLFPTINACLNFSAAVCLMLGWKAIARLDEKKHRTWMIAALFFSFTFLISYVTYHALHPGVTRYQGEGLLRAVYFFILLTHTPLAALIVPFVIAAVYFALRGERQRHTMITKRLLPVWLYVSVTGVAIYLMLYVLPN